MNIQPEFSLRRVKEALFFSGSYTHIWHSRRQLWLKASDLVLHDRILTGFPRLGRDEIDVPEGLV